MLSTITDAVVLDKQLGFRKGKCTIINIFIAQQIIENRRDFNLKTHIAFISFETHLRKEIAITCGTSSMNSGIQLTLQSL